MNFAPGQTVLEETLLALQHLLRVTEAMDVTSPTSQQAGLCWVAARAWQENKSLPGSILKSIGRNAPLLVLQADELPRDARCEFQSTFTAQDQDAPGERRECRVSSRFAAVV